MMKNKIVILLLFLLALFVRLYFLSYPKIIESDGVIYTRLAESLIKGEGFIDLDGGKSTIIRPLYPILIGVTDKIIHNLEVSGRIISIFFGSLIPLMIYLISKDIFERKTAILSAIFIAISPITASASIEVMTEAVYTFVISSGILCLYYALKKGVNFKFFIAGFIWGLSYLTRPEGIGYLILCLLLVIFVNFIKASLGRRIIFASWFIFGAFFTVFPLLIYLRISFGTWIPSPEIRYLGPIDLTAYLRNLYYSLYLREIPSIFSPLLIILFGIGLLRCIFAEGKIKENIYLLSFAFYPFLIYPWNTKILFFCRHFTIILPLLYIWVAVGLREFFRLISEVKYERNLRTYFLSFSIILVLADFMPRLIAPLKNRDKFLECPLEYKVVGKWIKENLGKNRLTISPMREIVFYSQARRLGIPKDLNTYAELIRYAKNSNSEYIIIDKRYTAKLYPWLSFLLEEKSMPHELELVYKWDQKPEYKVVVYKIMRK